MGRQDEKIALNTRLHDDFKAANRLVTVIDAKDLW
jgi:hypothetical protein